MQNQLDDAGERPSFPDESYDFCASAPLRTSSAISAFSRATLSAREAVERSPSGPTGTPLVAANGCAGFSKGRVFCLGGSSEVADTAEWNTFAAAGCAGLIRV